MRQRSYKGCKSVGPSFNFRHGVAATKGLRGGGTCELVLWFCEVTCNLSGGEAEGRRHLGGLLEFGRNSPVKKLASRSRVVLEARLTS